MTAAPQGEIIQFRIPSNPRYVCTVRRAVRSIAHSLGFSEEVSEDIELSVDEALTNAVLHGSPEQKKNAVVIVCRIGDDKLTIDVRDEGPGFEPLDSQGYYEPLGEQGRGLRLIYHLMDGVRVCHTPRGSRIRMVKRLSPGEAQPVKPSR